MTHDGGFARVDVTDYYQRDVRSFNVLHIIGEDAWLNLAGLGGKFGGFSHSQNSLMQLILTKTQILDDLIVVEQQHQLVCHHHHIIISKLHL